MKKGSVDDAEAPVGLGGWGFPGDGFDAVDALDVFGGDDGAGGALGDDVAIVHEDDAVGECGGEVEVVAGEEDGEVFVAGEAFERSGECCGVFEVEEGVGFV